MARSGVTFTEVEEAAQYLLGQGRNPTVDAIREHLGTGSRTTLAEHVRRWKALQGDGLGHLPQPLLAQVTGLWDSLQAQADQRVQEHQATAQQEITTLVTQLKTSQQSECQLRQDVHHLQEALDAEQHAKALLAKQLHTTEIAQDKLTALHQSTEHQLDDARAENQRLHNLAGQIQANLEHYQQAIQQQQLEQSLAKEKQQAIYAHEIGLLRTSLNESTTRSAHSEKELASSQFHLEQVQTNYAELSQCYENLEVKHKETVREVIQLQERENSQRDQLKKMTADLFTTQQLSHSLNQKIAVITDQLRRSQAELLQAHDKIEKLRHEKLFLVQEKAQIDGALKQLQKAYGT